MFLRARSSLVACALALACFSAPLEARAQQGSAAASDDDDARARQRFEDGRRAFDEARYDAAFRAFEEAYRLSKRPALLVNMSRALEAQGKSREAADALVLWLAVAPPDAPERELVEARRARLDAQAVQDERQRAASAELRPSAPARTRAPEPPAAPLAPPRRDLARGLRNGLWTGSAALAASGITLLALGRHDIRNVESPADGATWRGVSDDYDRGPRLVGAGVGLAAGAIVCGIAAALLEWRGHSSDRRVALAPAGAVGRF